MPFVMRLRQWNPAPVTKFVIVMCWIGLFLAVQPFVKSAAYVVPYLVLFMMGAVLIVAWALGFWRHPPGR